MPWLDSIPARCSPAVKPVKWSFYFAGFIRFLDHLHSLFRKAGHQNNKARQKCLDWIRCQHGVRLRRNRSSGRFALRDPFAFLTTCIRCFGKPFSSKKKKARHTLLFSFSEWLDSNQRLRRPERRALPNWATPRNTQHRYYIKYPSGCQEERDYFMPPFPRFYYLFFRAHQTVMYYMYKI